MIRCLKTTWFCLTVELVSSCITTLYRCDRCQKKSFVIIWYVPHRQIYFSLRVINLKGFVGTFFHVSSRERDSFLFQQIMICAPSWVDFLSTERRDGLFWVEVESPQVISSCGTLVALSAHLGDEDLERSFFSRIFSSFWPGAIAFIEKRLILSFMHFIIHNSYILSCPSASLLSYVCV